MPGTMLYSESTMMNKANIISVFMNFAQVKQGFGCNSYLSNWKRKALITEHIGKKKKEKDNPGSKLWLVQPYNKMFMQKATDMPLRISQKMKYREKFFLSERAMKKFAQSI